MLAGLHQYWFDIQVSLCHHLSGLRSVRASDTVSSEMGKDTGGLDTFDSCRTDATTLHGRAGIAR